MILKFFEVQIYIKSMKFIKRLLLFCVILCFFSATVYCQAKNNKKTFKVVIDAGHGGKDPGCNTKRNKEKNITLSLALMLGNLIETNCPDVKVIYTRKSDVFVELHKRAKIANESKADLFISVHVNANKSPKPYGFETFVMGLHKSEANLSVAKTENASILLEDDYSAQYDGFDPNSSESNIIFSLFQNAFLEQSLNLAAKIQNEVKIKTQLEDKGVKQAGFLVLYKTVMPGVLIESGFLSNPKDEAIISTKKGQLKVAKALYNAFRKYKSDLEGTVYVEDNNSTFVENQSTIDIDTLENNEIVENNDIDTLKNNYYHQVKDIDTIVVVDNKGNTQIVNPKSVYVKANTDSIKINNNQVSTNDNVIEKEEVFLSIQIATSSKKIPLNASQFKGLKNIYEYKLDGIYKYTYLKFYDLETANKELKFIQSKGFKDAFVVAFANNKRVTPSEALKLLKKK